MMLYFLVFWWILAIIDAGLTYYSLGLYHKLKPNSDYSRFEKNPLPRYFIQKLGLSAGITVFIIFILLITFVFTYFVFVFSDLQGIFIAVGFILGLYWFLIIFVHISNVRLLKMLVRGAKRQDIKGDVEKYLEYTEKRLQLLDRINNKK